MILKRNKIFICVGLRIIIGNHQSSSQQYSVNVMKHITSIFILVFFNKSLKYRQSKLHFFVFSSTRFKCQFYTPKYRSCNLFMFLNYFMIKCKKKITTSSNKSRAKHSKLGLHFNDISLLRRFNLQFHSQVIPQNI